MIKGRDRVNQEKACITRRSKLAGVSKFIFKGKQPENRIGRSKQVMKQASDRTNQEEKAGVSKFIFKGKRPNELR